MVCDPAGAYFHFLTAAAAFSARIGLPPRTSTLLTAPFGRTVAFRRTTPPTCARRRMSGYSGLVMTSTLRSDFAAFWASEAGTKAVVQQSASSKVAKASLAGLLFLNSESRQL